jgi:DNA polymerase alpha subunit B
MADAEIQDRFSPNKPLEPDVLSELESIMRLHGLSAEDLFFKWESYCIKLDIDAQDLNLETLRNLKQSIQDELENSHRKVQVKTERKVASAPRGGNKGGDVFGMLDGLVPSTPASGSKLNRGASGGSAIKKKPDTPKGSTSSPAKGMNDQLKSLNGLPYVHKPPFCTQYTN